MAPFASSIPGRWSPDQDAALKKGRAWVRSRDKSSPQVFRLFGYAGTGKSTLVQELVAESPRPWLYAAYTGKAALVMRQKGCPGAQTIHSLIYRPEGGARVGADGRRELGFRLHDESPLHWSPGIVLDECSMIDEEVGRDLLSFGKKILVCGDPGQLPPMDGGGFFTSCEPDALLTQVHRHARESGILDLATFVRNGGDLWDRVGWSTSDCAVVARSSLSNTDLWTRVLGYDQIIVGTNRMRQQINQQWRRLHGVVDAYPAVNDRVICLRNERRTGLFNGSMWRVRDATARPEDMVVELDLSGEDLPGVDLQVKSWAHHFLSRGAELEERDGVRMARQEFDYGYAVTCHKAQGSQWPDVALIDESGVFRGDDARRWLYTGVTRAARNLLVVV